MNDTKIKGSFDPRDPIQRAASNRWWNTGGNGTLNLHTGCGKNFASIRCILKLPKGSTVLFLAEQTDREKTFFDDVKKFSKLFNYDVLDNYKVDFITYQSAFRKNDLDYTLFIADEVHSAASLGYVKSFTNNKYQYIVGLSATTDDNVRYDDFDLYDKRKIIDKIAPIIYTHSLNDGVRTGTARKMNIYILENNLDDKDKYVESGSKAKRFFVTEKAAYDYWSSRIKKCDDIIEPFKRNKEKQRLGLMRSKILYNLKSKANIVEFLLNNIEGKSIVFGNSIDALLSMSDNVVTSRNSHEKNKEIKNNFQSGKIDTIYAYKKLEQGANLSSLDNVIQHSYTATKGKHIQRAGRARLDGDKKGNMFIIVTKGTVEEDNHKKFLEDLDPNLFNIYRCKSKAQFINFYENYD